MLNILDWKDATRGAVGLRTVATDAASTNVFGGLTSQPSDLLYADRLVFVEGPSDVVALKRLARDRCGIRQPVRYVPLRETDAVATEIARYFNVILQGHGLGFQTRGLLVLDADKEARLKKAWGKLNVDPTLVDGLVVVWVPCNAIPVILGPRRDVELHVIVPRKGHENGSAEGGDDRSFGLDRRRRLARGELSNGG
jgi:hypothetical protein